MIVVSNTSPLIGLASIHRLELLRHLFGKIFIPQAVYQETVIQGHESGEAKRQVASASWIETHHVGNRASVDTLLQSLDEGEAETIVLAGDLSADWVIMDERKGRRALSERGLKKIGTLGILLKAKQVGLLTVVRPDIELLCQEGFSVSQDIVDAVLHYADE